MRGRLTYFGIVLLLIGLVCIVYAGIKLTNVNAIVGPESPPEVWYYTQNLTKGKTYKLYIESGDDWHEPFSRGDFVNAQPVNVTITSPGGGVTSLRAFFYGLEGTTYLQSALAIDHVEYQNVDYASLTVDTSSSQIRFTIEKGGPYTARVLQEGLWSSTPPLFFRFDEELVENRETYTLLSSGGGALTIVGGITSVVTLFKKEDTKRKRERKSPHKTPHFPHDFIPIHAPPL